MDGMDIVYDALTLHKIRHWVKKAGTNEISGFGKVVLKDGVFKVVDAILLPQRNGAGHTEIEAKDVGKAEFLLKDTPGELRLWWHSHVKMSCFWSKTDTDTIAELGKHGWIIATVFNQKDEHRTCFYQGANGPAPELFVDELPIRSQFHAPENLLNPWDKEFADNVTVYSPPPDTKDHGGYWQRWEKEKWEKADGDATMASFRWPMGGLSKRERRIIASKNYSNEGLVLAILETQKYGKVVWTAANNGAFSKWITRPDNPRVNVSVNRVDIFESVTKIRWMRAPFVREMLELDSVLYREVKDLIVKTLWPKDKLTEKAALPAALDLGNVRDFPEEKDTVKAAADSDDEREELDQDFEQAMVDIYGEKWIEDFDEDQKERLRNWHLQKDDDGGYGGWPC